MMRLDGLSGTMPRAPPPDVRAYLAKCAPKDRAALLKLRSTILGILPDAAKERISYQIPGFEVDGRMVVWIAAFPKHCSLFGAHAGASAARAHGGDGYVVKGSTIQFDPARGLPATLVRAAVKARLASMPRPRAKRPVKKKATPRAQAPAKKRAAKRARTR